MTEKDITIVYSADKVVKPKTATDVWSFRPPNALKDKVGGMGAGGPGELPTELLEEAEEQLERAAPGLYRMGARLPGQAVGSVHRGPAAPEAAE